MSHIQMRCYCCDGADWHVVTIERDGKRMPIHSLSKIQICKQCGNACHEVDVSKEAEIKDYYRKEYRPQPNVINLITTTHKMNYVRVFLKDFLKERHGKQLVVGDVGAATGYLLNFFRQLGHKVSGSELTLTYRRMSEHYYGIPLAEELEPKHRYDLITVYHVLEHLMEPDKKLKHLVSLLSDGGHIMIATPEWFDVLEEASGTPMANFDHLFHKNHINLFSRASLQNLFRKCGLQIVKEDHLQYGQTYLLRKAQSPVVDGWLVKEDCREVERVMLNHRQAIELFLAGKYREAYDLVPKFPEAWLNFIFFRCTKDLAKQSEVFEDAARYVGDNGRFMAARGQWYYQQGRMAEAIADFQAILSLKPNEDTFMYLGYAFAQTGRTMEAIQCLQTAQAMDPRKWQEANSWILAQVSNMPAWDERALAEAKNAFSPKMAEATQDASPV